MKVLAYTAGLLGLALFVALLVHANGHDIVRINALAGWRLLWLVPFRGIYFLLFAAGWYLLLRNTDPSRRASFGFIFWVTGLREAIDRLLPVASVGGAFVGVRLMVWRGIARAPVSATIIAEILLTLWASYLFAVVGFLLMIGTQLNTADSRHFWIALLATLPVPVTAMLMLRRGQMFLKLQRILASLVGIERFADGARTLDQATRSLMSQPGSLLIAGTLQLLALVSASLEIWLALRWFGHPVGLTQAVILESATQAVRHLAFFVPAALGVQEVGLVAFGHLLGISPEMALAVSIAKRMREILCGVPYLGVWQWLEALRVRQPATRGVHL